MSNLLEFKKKEQVVYPQLKQPEDIYLIVTMLCRWFKTKSMIVSIKEQQNRIVICFCPSDAPIEGVTSHLGLFSFLLAKYLKSEIWNNKEGRAVKMKLPKIMKLAAERLGDAVELTVTRNIDKNSKTTDVKEILSLINAVKQAKK